MELLTIEGALQSLDDGEEGDVQAILTALQPKG